MSAALAADKPLKISVAEYKARVYSSWLGQCVGNVYGLPHENKYVDQPGPEKFPYGYSGNLDRLKTTNGVFSDDDTDIEYMYLMTMEKFGIEPTYDQFAGLWKYHVRDRVWLANRAALAAMHYGYTPPVTGSRAVNPHWFQIDPQLINEIMAVTAPGMVRYSAAKSGWAARIMDDGWGIEPTIHYGAMYSAAFFERDIQKLIDIGTAALPKGSRFAGTVEDMKALYRKYPKDWKAARAEMAKKYYINEPADSKTIWNANLNGAAGILALLYGGGDFQRTLDLACAMGFDADNQAATMSGLLGLIVGRKGIPDALLFPLPELKWKEPLNDLYKNVTRFDMPDASLKDIAEREARQGEKIILKYGGKKVTENGQEYYLINPNAIFTAPLELPAGPMPNIEAGQKIVFEFPVSGGGSSLRWKVASGAFPKGLAFRDGKLSGVTSAPGVYFVTLELAQGAQKASRKFTLVVRDKNLASSARRILARVERADVKRRDAMRVTVPRSLFADTVDVIRDGKLFGDRSTFYSISADSGPQTDYYGYEWDKPQTVGLMAYHNGSVEESGGWFSTLNVEYRNAAGSWAPVEGLVINPRLPGGDQPFDKPHFVEYLLAFRPVQTTAVRIIGNAGGVARGGGRPAMTFTSITELGAYGALPGHEQLKQD